MIELQPNPETGGERLVAVGRMGAPQRVAQADFDALPNKDARSSFFQHFLIDGVDLSGYDCRDWTTYNGVFSGCNLYTARSKLWHSRGVSFSASPPPRDATSLSHDFATAVVDEYLRRNPSLVARSRETVDKVRQSASTLTDSWDDCTFALLNQMGRNETEVAATYRAMFARWPRMLERTDQLFSKRTWTAEKYEWPYPVWADAARVQAQLTNPNDRFEARRFLEGDVEPGLMLPRYYVMEWEPKPYLFTKTLPFEWGWWENVLSRLF